MFSLLHRSIFVIFCCSRLASGERPNSIDSQAAIEPGDKRKSSVEKSGVLSSNSSLLILAATYNAGNTVFAEPKLAADLIATLTKGHEDRDIVLLGFQEFLDACKNGVSLAAHIAEDHLWGGGSELPNEVSYYQQTFATGAKKTPCHAGSHYNTVLQIYVNPLSMWAVELPDAGSEGWKRGLNLDFGSVLDFPFQCGKGVNIVKMNVKHASEGQSVALCALNTHMSFRKGAKTRMEAMNQAMAKAEEMGCEATIFLGDFNTRLHCESPSTLKKGVPLNFDAADSSNSFANVIQRFCKNGGNCSLAKPQSKGEDEADEMRQLLSRETLRCFEKPPENAEDGAKWDVEETKNTVKQWSYKEAMDDGPDFPPSYKHEVKTQELEKSEWAACFPDEPVCLANSDKDNKHNPAWTDRVLVSGSADRSWDVTADVYERRPGSFGSDHAAVVAQLSVSQRAGANQKKMKAATKSTASCLLAFGPIGLCVAMLSLFPPAYRLSV